MVSTAEFGLVKLPNRRAVPWSGVAWERIDGWLQAGFQVGSYSLIFVSLKVSSRKK